MKAYDLDRGKWTELDDVVDVDYTEVRIEKIADGYMSCSKSGEFLGQVNYFKNKGGGYIVLYFGEGMMYYYETYVDEEEEADADALNTLMLMLEGKLPRRRRIL